MKKVYGDDMASGLQDLNDDVRPGCPEAGSRAELVEKLNEIFDVLANFTVRMLGEELNTSKNTIWRILTEDLGKRRVCLRFVPHELNEDQKVIRVEHCKDIVSTAENDPIFLDSIIIGDETWCFKYDLETKH